MSVSSVLNSPTLAACHHIVCLSGFELLKNENLLVNVIKVSFFEYKRIKPAGITNSQAKKRNKLYLINEFYSVSYGILDHVLQWKL